MCIFFLPGITLYDLENLRVNSILSRRSRPSPKVMFFGISRMLYNADSGRHEELFHGTRVDRFLGNRGE
jgi:hypothetical protein